MVKASNEVIDTDNCAALLLGERIGFVTRLPDKLGLPTIQRRTENMGKDLIDVAEHDTFG